MSPLKKFKTLVALLGLSIGCEVLYMVPMAVNSLYVLFQSATGYSNAQIGLLMTVYGIGSVPSNILGAYLSDRFNSRNLVAAGFLLCGVLSFWIAALPRYSTMLVLYGMHVMASGMAYNSSQKILRFMGNDDQQAMLVTIRTWLKQGTGLVLGAAGIALIALTQNPRNNIHILLSVYSALLLLGGIILFLFFDPVVEDVAQSSPPTREDYKTVLKNKYVWMVAIMGFSLYMGVKVMGYIQSYLSVKYGVSDTIASTLGLIDKDSAFFAVSIITFFASKKLLKSVSRAMTAALICASCSMFYFAFFSNPRFLVLGIIVFVIASLSIQGSQDCVYLPIYECGIPIRLTGLAVGVVATISFTVDIFFYSLFGTLIDRLGDVAYTYAFTTVGIIMAISAVICYTLSKQVIRYRNSAEPQIQASENNYK